jgi:hypothetical protein
MSALPPIADIPQCRWDVRKVPLADIEIMGAHVRLLEGVEVAVFERSEARRCSYALPLDFSGAHASNGSPVRSASSTSFSPRVSFSQLLMKLNRACAKMT